MFSIAKTKVKTDQDIIVEQCVRNEEEVPAVSDIRQENNLVSESIIKMRDGGYKPISSSERNGNITR